MTLKTIITVCDKSKEQIKVSSSPTQ